jgi:hypothetical protein
MQFNSAQSYMSDIQTQHDWVFTKLKSRSQLSMSSSGILIIMRSISKFPQLGDSSFLTIIGPWFLLSCELEQKLVLSPSEG